MDYAVHSGICTTSVPEHLGINQRRAGHHHADVDSLGIVAYCCRIGWSEKFVADMNNGVLVRRRGGAKKRRSGRDGRKYATVYPITRQVATYHQRRLATSTRVGLSSGLSANSTGTLSAIKGSRPSKYHYFITRVRSPI
jgi:hypothetical protein